jgi:hypothetical protein
MSKKQPPLLSPLTSSHRPRLRQSYDQPIQDEVAHRAMIKSWDDNEPEYFASTDDFPYYVAIMEDGQEILFDYSNRPMWQRRSAGHRAERCDPKDYFNWFARYFLFDFSLRPLPLDFPLHERRVWSDYIKARLYLREQLLLVMSIFIDGGPLLVAKWTPLPPEPPNNVIQFRKP